MKKLLERLDKLIAEAYGLREQWRDINAKPDRYREEAGLSRTRWLRSCENFFEFASMPKFAEEFQAISRNQSHPSYQIAQLIGILQSAKDEIQAGFIFKIKYLLHADFFNSIVDQAEDLLRTGHKIPSAVLGRIVIEQWLKDEAEKAGIPINETDKAAVVNDRLKNEKIFSIPRWRQVQSFLDIGNSAAHGRPDDFADDDVRRMMEFIRTTSP